jgi:preprotein translocase SecE subunit
MARNRQRSKQRQAERRARRLEQERAQAQRGGSDGSDIPGITPAPIEPIDAPGIDPDLAAGAPPEEEGRSDSVLEGEESLLEREEELFHPGDASAPVSEEEAYEEIEDWEVADQLDDPDAAAATASGAGEAGYAVRGRRGREAEAHRDRPRVVQFLIAVWAELQRVQWPNRQALVTLTGVVLGFVLIAGGYLGLLDAIFNELIKAIL